MKVSPFYIFKKKYKMVKKLFDGSSSKVFLIKSIDNGRLFACKRIKDSKFFEKEYKYPNSMESDRIVKINEIFVNCIGLCSYYYLVMDYFGEDSDLFESIRDIIVSEVQLSKIVSEMSLAVKECHDRDIVHLDIKSENYIIINKNPLKLMLIDFGCSHKIDECMRSISGTLLYIAPEIINLVFSKASDIWSLGSFIVYMINTNIDLNVNKETIVNQIDDISDITEDLKNLLKLSLSPNPAKRPTIEEFIDHPWFKKNLHPSRV